MVYIGDYFRVSVRVNWPPCDRCSIEFTLAPSVDACNVVSAEKITDARSYASEISLDGGQHRVDCFIIRAREE